MHLRFSVIHLFKRARPQPALLKLPCWKCRSQYLTPRRYAHTPAENNSFESIVDGPPLLVRSGQRHGPGLIILVLIPITAFALGTWQIFRLGWKTELLAKLEDRLVRPPLPLPPGIDPSAIKDFDYRRVYATGRLRHDKEMLIGPRIRDGTNGYLVITPLDRDDRGSTVLVNRGWISKEHKSQASRLEGLPLGQVTVQGLLREPWQKNYFTPENRPDIDEFYFPDVHQMADLSGSTPVWIEETMEPNLLMAYDRESKGIPIGRAPEVNLTNNHGQYIFTWYSLSLATSIMFWMVVRKPPSEVARRVRLSREW